MEGLLVRLMISVTLLQLGLTAVSLKDVRKVEKASRDVLKIDWKPISIFSEEAKRFR